MKVTKRDLIAAAVTVMVIVVLILSVSQKKVKQVPADDKHRVFNQNMEKGQDRIELEKGCVACHNPQAIPLPKKHPPKEQCLICHKLTFTKR